VIPPVSVENWNLVVPHAVTNRPNPSFLEERYELFRQAG